MAQYIQTYKRDQYSKCKKHTEKTLAAGTNLHHITMYTTPQVVDFFLCHPFLVEQLDLARFIDKCKIESQPFSVVFLVNHIKTFSVLC